MYILKYRRRARNYLAHLPFKVKTEIVKRLHELARDPDNPALNIRALKGRVGFRLRVDRFRVIYTRHNDELVIEVVKIRSRGDVYKR